MLGFEEAIKKTTELMILICLNSILYKIQLFLHILLKSQHNGGFQQQDTDVVSFKSLVFSLKEK